MNLILEIYFNFEIYLENLKPLLFSEIDMDLRLETDIFKYHFYWYFLNCEICLNWKYISIYKLIINLKLILKYKFVEIYLKQS